MRERLTERKLRRAVTRPKFKSWLEHQVLSREVSREGYNYNSCPLANYLKNEFGVYFFVGGFISHGYGSKEVKIKTPEWAKNFIGRVDKEAGFTLLNGAKKAVTVQEALVALSGSDK